MTTLYQTDNIEAAIRFMTMRNDRCVLFKYHLNKKRIRLRGWDIKDLGGVLCKPTSPLADASINKWKQQRGVLHYEHNPRADKLPNADAILFVECPHQYTYFERHASHIASEIIIYRPPTWTLHEETIERFYPTSIYYQTLLLTVDALRDRELSSEQYNACQLSGIEKPCAFVASEIEAITGIGASQINRLLKHTRYVTRSVRYTLLDPVIAPDNPIDNMWFDKILAMPDIHNGYRMLTPGDLVGSGSSIRRMIRQGCLRTKPDIYVVGKMDNNPRYDRLDALSTMYRADWYKMRNLVDNAPKYPIPQSVLADLAQIRSERHARSLFLAQIFDKADSVQP